MDFKTPILLILFNRLDTTQQVFAKIREIQPPYLYISADGPREGNNDDEIKCEKVRKYILENIDWKCDVKTLFQEKNLGCGLNPATAITWFFENVEQGIILEDDCVPSISFFRYCEELLDKYKNEERIGMISGNNFFELKKLPKESYLFSYGNIWGWAAWRRSWKYFDMEMKQWNEPDVRNRIKMLIKNDKIFRNISTIFQNNFVGCIDIWDYQWLFARLSHGQLTINPTKNLVSNIGFNDDATHTKGFNRFSNIKTFEMDFPLIHPKHIKVNKEYISLQYSVHPNNKNSLVIFDLLKKNIKGVLNIFKIKHIKS